MADDDIIPYSLSWHPDPHRHAVSVGALLASMFIAPAFWAGNLIIDYALVSHSCYPGGVPLPEPAPAFDFVWPLVFAFHLFSLLIIAGGFVLGFRNWRVTRSIPGEPHQPPPHSESRSRFFGKVAMAWSAVFFLIVATQTVAFNWVGLCER